MTFGDLVDGVAVVILVLVFLAAGLILFDVVRGHRRDRRR